MKITLVSMNYSPEPTGSAPYVGGLARGLMELGHEVRVVTGIQHYPEWRNVSGQTEARRHDVVDGVPVLRLKHYVPPGGAGWRRLLMEASFSAQLLTAPLGRPDLVVTLSPALVPAAVAIARTKLFRRSTPVVAWVHDLYSSGLVELGGRMRHAASAARAFESFVLGKADAVVVIHERFRRVVIDGLGLDADKVYAERLWSHVADTPITADRAAVRARLGWGDRPVVLHAGNMGRKQGLTAVVAAAKVAQERKSDLLFVLMGDGVERARLAELAAGCDNLQMLPPLPGEEFPAALAAADVLLVNELSGVKEMSLPSKLTTYFTTGRPVLAAVDPQGICAEEMAISGGGVVIPAGDAEGMVRAAEELAADRSRSEELGRAGREFAATRLATRPVIDRFETLLKRVAASDSPRVGQLTK